MILFPDAPTGCPRAMAPPFTLAISAYELFLVDAMLLHQLVDDTQRLGGEGLVQLHHFDVGKLHTCVFVRCGWREWDPGP